jgi:hypothetical protein
MVLSALFSRDPIARYRARHRIVRVLCRRWGLSLYEEYTTWAEDPECTAVWRSYPESGAAPLLERHFNLYYLARSARDVGGDTAECGVYRGRGSWFILNALPGPDRRHFVFDSFEGLSEPRAADKPDRSEAYAWARNDLAMGQQIARRNLAAFEGRVSFHKGWIPERFPDVEDRRFSLVHLDVDLFQPTQDSLSFFYPRMTPGAILVCDDYGFSTCPGALRAMDEFFADKPETVIPLTTGQAVVIKR